MHPLNIAGGCGAGGLDGTGGAIARSAGVPSPGRRQEIAPAEQLESLRRARDHYLGLAETIHAAGPRPGEARKVWRARELNARRIALAYQKSLATQARLMNLAAGD
jgi:hypothetical protein